MIHVRQGKPPRKKRLPLRDLTFAQLVRKAQAGSESARRELEKRANRIKTMKMTRKVQTKNEIRMEGDSLNDLQKLLDGRLDFSEEQKKWILDALERAVEESAKQSRCVKHKTFPDDNESCWQCIVENIPAQQPRCEPWTVDTVNDIETKAIRSGYLRVKAIADAHNATLAAPTEFIDELDERRPEMQGGKELMEHFVTPTEEKTKMWPKGNP